MQKAGGKIMIRKNILTGLLIGAVLGSAITLTILLCLIFSRNDVGVSLEKTSVILRGFIMALGFGLAGSLIHSVYIVNRLFWVSGTRMLKMEPYNPSSYQSEEDALEEKRFLEIIEKDRKNLGKTLILYFCVISLFLVFFICSIVFHNLHFAL